MDTTAKLTAHNGTYTVSVPAELDNYRKALGSHFTVKLHTAAKGNLKGKRILSLLVGPDNVSDYAGVAFWDDARREAFVWRKHKGANSSLPIDGYHMDRKGFSLIEKKLAILLDLAVRGERGFSYNEGLRLHLEGRCVICNRKLTTPESIESGIGPTCAGRN